ncbi:MAG: YggT family protein [Proteobacteria bacterium]|uniref:YggT family protein n=1 Tax=SAR86 cluster bacterium TaxID=2030880 RepID=A0A937IDC5_9GAMM|nr:YggT family protein [SAR86 cluster bacterium]MDA0775238.1 YggT family protein [Pseudomonadota bacterium]MDA0976461.1 YggT family protein [Pseudomonadota bacterium]MDA1037078.1 YggT family protein [Pseudomonadota bacterium]
MSGLLGIVFSILSYVFIILFVFNLLKIDYYNPIVKAFLNFYKPISLISIFSNQIYTIFLVAVILKFSGFYILYSSQFDQYVLGIVSVIEVINTTLTIFFFSIIGAVILSWVAPNSPNPILKIIEEISDNLLAPIRKFIPALGGLDFSPIFALILIRQLEIFLASIVRSII